jgi:single-stranded DNA-binding protein
LIYVEGKLRSEIWKDKAGNEKSGIKIRATALNLLQSKPIQTSEN